MLDNLIACQPPRAIGTIRHLHSEMFSPRLTHATSKTSVTRAPPASMQPQASLHSHYVSSCTPPLCARQRVLDARYTRLPQHARRRRQQSCVWRCTVHASAQQMPQLTDKEDAARLHFLDQLTSDEARSVKQQAIMLLTHAARNRDVDAQLVTGALAHLESVTAAQSTATLEQLQGRWKLVFGSNGPPFMLYIPINEVTDIDSATSTIDLRSDIGPLAFTFFGGFSWQAPSDMQFAFSRIRITAFQREVYSKQWAPEKHKVYSFFHVNDNIAAVRSSQGGYILMLRVSSFRDDCT